MLRFVPDHLRTNKIFKKAFEKLPFGIIHALDQCKTQEMCDKVISFNKYILMLF